MRMKYCQTTAELHDAMRVVLGTGCVSVDLEGQDLGRNGKISLVQLSCERGLYVIDVLKVSLGVLIQFMQALFSGKILKLMYDCRSDCDAMAHLWGVRVCKNIFDIQILEVLSRKEKQNPYCTRIRSLKWCLKEFSVGDTSTLDEVSKRMREGGSAFWMERPLDAKLLEYAAEDVSLLVDLYYSIIKNRDMASSALGGLRSASIKYAYLKVDVSDKSVLNSNFYNNSLLPLGVISSISGRRVRCQGCKRMVAEARKGKKKAFCGVCWNVKVEDRPDASLMRKTTMCKRGDTCRKYMWGDCWFAHTREEMRCRKFALSGKCSNAFCDLKHTLLEATGQVTRQQQMDIKFTQEQRGDPPVMAKIEYEMDLPTLRMVIPRFLLEGVAASSEESRKKKGWYGARFLRDLYTADKLGIGQGNMTRESALGKPQTARQFFKNLLAVETTQNISDVRAYDLHNAAIRRDGQHGLYRIDCKGLAEKRPSVLRGDKVRVRDNGSMRWHLGFVHFVNLDHVLVKFGIGFLSSERTTFLVIFSMPETNWRKQFLAVDEAPLLTDGYIESHFADCHDREWDSLQYYNNASSKTNMNLEQKECVNRILQPVPCGKHHLVLLHGPPGTGKTTTLVDAINLILVKGILKFGFLGWQSWERPRILVATPSNEAANLLFERLVERGGASCGTKHIRLLAESYNIESCSKDVRRFAKRASGLTVADLEGAELIVCTLMVTGTLYTMGVKKGNFTHIAVDEAGQATETELLVPLQFMNGPHFELGERGTVIAFAGDHKQLGPVLRSMPCQVLGFGVSVLERLMKTCPQHSVQLLDSYRAHPSIMAVYNELTYNNTLRARAPLAKRELLKGTSLFPYSLAVPSEKFHPLAFYHVAGKETREEDSPSWKNEAEAYKVVDLVEELLNTGKLKFEDIVVLTPYLKQCQVIRDKIHYKFEAGYYPFIKPWNYKRNQLPVSVCSVETFQGREANVIILSCVRSQEADEVPNDHRQSIGFLQQPQRLNVAISRPIAALFVVGNIGTLMSDPHWEKLIGIFHRFNAILQSNGSSLTDACFEQIKIKYASQTIKLKNHATSWVHVAPTEGEYETLPPMDTDWNRVE